MKKVISVSMVIAILFAFTACSSKEYTEIPVTVEVTDENGEAVTDTDGNAVTEVVTDENGSTKTETKKNTTAASKNDGQNSNNDNSGNSGNNSNGGNNQGGNDSNNNNNNTDKEDNTTKPTEKPKKRDVTITVNLPYYNGVTTNIVLFYTVDGGDEEELEPVSVKLNDNKKTEKFVIEDVKGEIYAYILFKDKDIVITKNSVTIPAGEDAGGITPVTGIEIMDGGMD